MTALEPLYKIEAELEALVDSLDTCPDELRPELEARIAHYMGQEVEKVDRVNAVLSALEYTAKNARTEIDRLRDRAQAADRAAERLKSYVLHVVQQRDGGPLRGRNVTFTARESEAVIVQDPGLVPEEFRRTVISVEVQKEAVKRALRAGQEVPGVTLERRPYLMRR